MEPDESVPAVVRGDIDLAVVLDWYNKPLPVPDGLAKAALLDDLVDVAMPADHPFAERCAVEPEDFVDDEWISWPEGGFCYDWLMVTLRGKGIEPHIRHTAPGAPDPARADRRRARDRRHPASAGARCPRGCGWCR